jgi:hypothetical protein
MRHVRVPLLCLLCLCLVALVAGCGSTVSSSGGSTDNGTFTLGANPSLTIAQGQSITLTVTPASANHFAGSIKVSVSGLPTGVTVSPANATVAMGSSTTLTLTAAADAAVGSSAVKVNGASGTLSTSTSIALTVTAATTSSGDFTLTASPATLTMTPGASGAGDADQYGDRQLRWDDCDCCEQSAQRCNGISCHHFVEREQSGRGDADGGGRCSCHGIAGAGELCRYIGGSLAHRNSSRDGKRRRSNRPRFRHYGDSE